MSYSLKRLVDYGIISSKLHASNRAYNLSTIMCDMFHQNLKQNQQDKSVLPRQDDNNNKDNPSHNSDILVHLSD